MSITFAVDQVVGATERSGEQPIADALAEIAGREVLAWSTDAGSVLVGRACHPFASAVHRAFSEHRPLVLSPDAVWLTIAQGFSQHVHQDPKALRGRLVSHTGTRTVQQDTRRLATREDGACAIDGLCAQVRRECTVGWIRNDFSTSTPTTRVAGDVVLLDAVKRYFRFRFRFICGIPEVTLLGLPEDWRKIETRVEQLAAYDLDWWTDLLLPVCRELRRSAEGSPDLDFWQSIYMPEEVYGGQDVTGWLTRFFPYVDLVEPEAKSSGLHSRRSEADELPAIATRNPGLKPWSGEPKGFRRRPRPAPAESRRRWLCEGIDLRRLPLGLSTVPVEIRDVEDTHLADVHLLAGFVGVSQSDSLALQAEIGWAVVRSGEELVRIEDWHS